MYPMRTSGVLEQITSHYLSSQDFNGTLITDLGDDNEKVRQVLKELLLDDRIVLNFGDRHPNPYILALEPEPQTQQLGKLQHLIFEPPQYKNFGLLKLQTNSISCCAYPSESHLASVVSPEV